VQPRQPLTSKPAGNAEGSLGSLLTADGCPGCGPAAAFGALITVTLILASYLYVLRHADPVLVASIPDAGNTLALAITPLTDISSTEPPGVSGVFPTRREDRFAMLRHRRPYNPPVKARQIPGTVLRSERPIDRRASKVPGPKGDAREEGRAPCCRERPGTKPVAVI
jgi:hypothetical protein